ncbi:MAG: CHAT domain-containing protein, partial [Acidimicrobiales bacterium]
MEHLDFEISVGDGEGQDYHVEVLRSPAGEAQQRMTFPFSQLDLRDRLKTLEIALLRSSSPTRRRVETSSEKEVREFGAKLFDALMAGEVRNRYDVSKHEARQKGKGLRIKLRFESPELASLPWEFLYDSRADEYLCLSSDTPLVRYLELSQPIQALTVAPPLRILGMVASPTGLDDLDVGKEQRRVEEAIQPLRDRGLVTLEWMKDTTWRELHRMLRKQDPPWHVFHFLGHGGFDPISGEGLLILTDDDGGPRRLPARDLGRLLGDHHALRLAVLNSCDGARADKRDIFSSTAATLVRKGTPAVVAMQYEISDTAAVELARSFYESVADGLPVDCALTEARKSVTFALSNTLEWGTPVLFMRAPNGVLFDLPAAPKPPAPVIDLAAEERAEPAATGPVID